MVNRGSDEKAGWHNCFGTGWSDSLHLNCFSNLEEIVKCFGETRGSQNIVWRGQSNCMWPAFPSLYRRLRYAGLLDEQINEGLVALAESRIIESAKVNALLDDGDSVLDFMVRLQHYGGATRLLDVTYDPFVALYFASGSPNQTPGVIFRYRINPDRVLDVDGGALWEDVIEKGTGGRVVLVRPLKLDRRIVVQSGAFVATKLERELSASNVFTNVTYDTEISMFLIRSDLKAQIRKYLSIEKNINEQTLFPDLSAFAKENGQRSAFSAWI